MYLCGGTRLYELLRHQINEWLVTVDTNTYPSDSKLPWVEEFFKTDDWTTEVYKILTPTVTVYKVTRNVAISATVPV